ncbi:MAG: hypothetical protein P8099_12605 [Gemmatimonadota bacterium]
MALELQDIADVGAAKRVDGLVVVAHHAHVAPRTSQEACHVELHGVRVLVLVHHEVVPTAPYVPAHLLVLLQQLHR